MQVHRRGRVLPLHTEKRRFEVSDTQRLSRFSDLHFNLSAAHLRPGEVAGDLFSDLQRKQQLKSNICLRMDAGAVLKSTLCVSVLQAGHSAGLVAG